MSTGAVLMRVSVSDEGEEGNRFSKMLGSQRSKTSSILGGEKIAI